MKAIGLLWLALLALQGGVAHAATCRPQAVRFAPGARSAALAGAIPRGGRDCYTITARAGQRLSVRQTDREESNVVLQLYRPPWRIVPGDDDGEVVGGRTLPGAGEGEDAPRWSGRLPVSGKYLLVLGTMRGGGEYAVQVEVR